MVGLVAQVSTEHLVDQESLADQEHQACQERKVSRDGMGSLVLLVLKESQVG